MAAIQPMGPLIEFCLELIYESLVEFAREFRPRKLTQADRIELAREHFKGSQFTGKDYMSLHKTISTATAKPGLSGRVGNPDRAKTGGLTGQNPDICPDLSRRCAR